MSRLSMIGLVALGVFTLGSRTDSGASAQPDETVVREFMRAKLEASQNVLEGLVIENPDLIVRGADRMQTMGKAAEWQVLRTPEYLQYSAQFQRAAESLAKAGREKKFDSARVAYLQLTLSCFECHKHTRSVKTARLMLPEPAQSASWTVALAGETR